MAAVLGGLDALVFSGGIGENSPEVRRHTCEELEFLGITLDDGRNRSGEPMISTDASPTRVRVIRTDEETVIARETIRLGFQYT
jgi:acetate kinase